MNEEDLILEDSDKVRLLELLKRMQDDGRTKQDLDLAVQMFTDKYAKKKSLDTESITSDSEDGVSEPNSFEFDPATKTFTLNGEVVNITQVPDEKKEELIPLSQQVLIPEGAPATPYPIGFGSDGNQLSTIPFGENESDVFVDSDGLELYNQLVSKQEELARLSNERQRLSTGGSFGSPTTGVTGSSFLPVNLRGKANELDEKIEPLQIEIDEINSNLSNNIEANKIIQQKYNYDILKSNEPGFDYKLIYSMPAETYFNEPADEVYGRGLNEQELNQFKNELMFERSNDNFGIVPNILRNIDDDDTQETLTQKIISSVNNDLESNMRKYLSDDELALAKLRTKAFELERQLETALATDKARLITELSDTKRAIQASTTTKEFFNLDGSRRDAPISEGESEVQEFNEQVDVNYQLFDQTERGQFLTIYERLSSVQKQLDADFENLTYRNTNGEYISIKDALNIAEFNPAVGAARGLVALFDDTLDSTLDLLGLLPEEKVNAKRVIESYQDRYRDNEAKLIAMTRLIGANTDPGSIDKGGFANIKLFGESLGEGFGGIFIDDFNIQTDKDFLESYVQLMKENGIELTESQLAEAENDISDMVASGLGTSIPIMLQIMITRQIPVGALGAIKQLPRYRAMANYLTSKGTIGKYALSLAENTVIGGTSFGLVKSDDISVAMGFGEGFVGGTFDTFFPKSKTYYAIRSIFGAASARGINTGAYSLRVLGGGAGELVAEYSGEMLDNMFKRGYNWEQALERTVGRTGDEALDKLIATAITCTMFSSAFNAGMLNLTMDEINTKYGGPNITPEAQNAVNKINEIIGDFKNSSSGGQLSLFDAELFDTDAQDNPYLNLEGPEQSAQPEIDLTGQTELDLFTDEATSFAEQQMSEVLSQKVDGRNNIKLGRINTGMSDVKVQKAVNDFNNDVQSEERAQLEKVLKTMYDSGTITFKGSDGKKVIKNTVSTSDFSDVTNDVKVTNDRQYVYGNPELLEEQFQLNMEMTKNGTVEGGTTFNDSDGNLFGQKKFAVSIFPDLSVTKQKGEGTFSKEEIAAFKEKHKDILDGNKNLAVGTYTSPETGISYLDVTAVMSDATTAQKLAIQYNQESYFDLERGKEIRTGGTGAPIEGMESVEQRVADIETLQVQEGFTKKVIKKIESFEKNIGDLRYSDPFLATATVKAALAIMRKSIQAGVSIKKAIDQAVAYIKANKKQGEIFDETNFRSLFSDKPNNVTSSATTTKRNRNEEGIIETNENELESEGSEIILSVAEPEESQINRQGDASRMDSADKKRKSDYEKKNKKITLEEARLTLLELGFDENIRIKDKLIKLVQDNPDMSVAAFEAIASRELQNGASAAAKLYADDVVGKMDGGLGKSHITKSERDLSDRIIEYERIIALDKVYDGYKLQTDALIKQLSEMEVGTDSYNETLEKINTLSSKMGITFDPESGNLMFGEEIVPEGLVETDGAPIRYRLRQTVGVDGQMVSSADAQAFLDRESANNPDFERAQERANIYFEASDNLLKFKLEEGLIDQETFNRLSQIKYSPRVFIEHLSKLEDGVSKDGSINQLDTPLKTLDQGSDKTMHNDATDLIIKQIAGTYKLAFKNRARAGLFEFINESNRTGLDISDFGYIIDNKNTLKDGYVPMDVYIDGKRVSMAIDQDMAASFEGGTLTFPGYMRWLSGSQILKTFATGINPLFALTNFPRDFVHVIMSTDTYGTVLPISMAKMSYDIIKTLPDAITRGPQYQKAISQGMGMDFLTTQGKVSINKGDTRFQKSAKNVFNALSWFGETSELMVRLAVRSRQITKRTAEFEKINGRKPNAQELEKIERMASNDSRQTMDFGKGGRWSKEIDTVIPYLNASLQGFRVSAKYMKDNPGKSVIKITQLGVAAMALTARNIMQYREDYDKISQYEKINNFIFMLPTKDEDGNRQYMRVRKDHFMIPFTTFFDDMAYQYLTGLNPNEGKQHFSLFMDDEDKSNLRKAWDMSMPLEGFDITELATNIPIINALNTYQSNYDSFRDREVFYDAEDYPDRLEYYRGTSKIYKQIGESLNLSPARLEAAVGKITTDPRNNVYYQAIDGVYEEITEGMDDSQIVEFDKTISKGWLEQLGESSYRTVVRSVPEFAQDESISVLKKAKQVENGKKLVINRTKYFMADEYAKADEDKRKEIMNNLFDLYRNQVSLELGYEVDIEDLNYDNFKNTIEEITIEKEFDVSPAIAQIKQSMGRNPEAAAITYHYLMTETAKKFGDPSPEMSKLIEDATKVGILKEGDTKFNRYLLNLKSEQNRIQE
tara:strand:+ start:12110 stop:18961 length:6852 start_codon:yes stop_codon:yes gene_type:complete